MKNELSRINGIRYTEYSGYIIMLTVFVLIYSLVIFLGEYVYLFIDNLVLHEITFVFEFCIAVGLFVMSAISYYAYADTMKIRHYTYFIACLIAGVFMGQYLFNYRWMNIDFSFSYSVISKVVLYLGFIMGGAVDDDRTHTNHGRKARVVFLFATIAFIGFTELINGKGGIMYYLLMIIDSNLILLEFLVSLMLLGAIALAVKSYELTRNSIELKYCTGLTGLLVAQVMRISTVRFSDIEYAGYTFILFLGVVYIIVSFYKFFVDLPRNDLKKAEQQIKLYADNLENIIEKRTDEMREANSKLINEIEYAKSIQQSLLPPKRLNFRSAMFVSEYFPCERLSGDFYDIYRIDDDHIGMYVLDVSGHGISAALMTMFCNNYVKSTEKLIQRYRGLKPHRNLKHFYEEFNKMNFPDEMHMVIFFASYNMETQELTYSSGGMNCYPILVKKNGESGYLDQSHGFPICKMSEFITPEYESVKIKLDKGDRIIFYTDGLIDKTKNGMLGEEDLMRVLRDHKEGSLRALDTTIYEILKPILSEIDDDITYFIMEVS